MIYDIIGDIHGQAHKLIGLLTKLGYQNVHGVFVPPRGHKAVFVGDFVDRGSQQLKTLQIIFAMLDNGYAYAVMGNHEYNAIAFATQDDTGNYLRSHSEKNLTQHKAFLDEVGFGTDTHYYWLKRFLELSLWLEFDKFAVIHACFSKKAMHTLTPHLKNNKLPKESFVDLHQNSDTYHAIHELLSGIEVIVPEPHFLIDGQGIKRNNMRIAWWLDELNQPLLNISASSNCNTDNIDPNFYAKVPFELTYDKPIFIGHYWLKGTPSLLSGQVVCVDYSAGTTGFLTAYQFDDDNPTLNHHKFCQYYHDE